MNNLRLVKITNKIDNKIIYQIQKHSRFFGWVEYGNRSNCLQSTFSTLDEANLYFNAYNSGSLYDVQVLQ
jgi:hypothetical protein